MGKQILVLENESLLSTSILNLLGSRTDLNIVSVVFDELAKADLVNCGNISVIILVADQARANFSELMDLIERCAEVRLVMVRPEGNTILILDKRMVYIEEVVDFLNLL